MFITIAECLVTSEQTPKGAYVMTPLCHFLLVTVTLTVGQGHKIKHAQVGQSMNYHHAKLMKFRDSRKVTLTVSEKICQLCNLKKSSLPSVWLSQKLKR